MRVRYSFSSRRTGVIDPHNRHRKEFADIVSEILEKCEIVLEVLDSRFIDETRNLALEKLSKEKSKTVIYVLNKSDLVNLKEKRQEAELKNLYPFVFVSCTKRNGGGNLRKRIKIEANRIKAKNPSINVGVVGYPNTGKSSVINLLVGRGIASVSSQPGFTKGIKRIKLAENLFVLDTPGVIAKEKYSMSDTKKLIEQTKINARSSSNVRDPELVVHTLMRQFPGILEKHYNIEASGDSEKFIEELGKKRSFLLKGGIVDTNRTSRLVITEWQKGKIKI